MATAVYVQYSGLWSLSSVANGRALGTWATQPYQGGGLWTWGDNADGAAGNGNTTNTSSPAQVGALTTWVVIVKGHYNGYGIKADGTLWSWGSNQYGQLGLGNTLYFQSPMQVGALTNWSKVSSLTQFAMAIKTDGTLWGWGYNNQGNLGLNNRTAYSSPKQVGALTNWSTISCGPNYAASVKTDGTLWIWGINNNGQLGTGNLTYRSSPVQVGSLTTWASVNCAVSSSTLAIKTDGTLWSWGYNGDGQLGLNNRTTYSSPKQIGILTNWSQAIGGYTDASLAIKTDGTLWSWGKNNYGQLGLGNRTYYSSPKQVGALTNWSAAVGNNSSITALKTDGTLWSWGLNAQGQLGLGNVTNYSSPKQVGALTIWQRIGWGAAIGP